MNFDIRDKVNSLLDDHYLVLINKKYGGFALSYEAIEMILNKFPNIPDLKSRVVYEYYPDFDLQFWNKTVRSNQDIVRFLLDFILNCDNVFTGINMISGNHCSIDIVFVPMVDGEPIPYNIEEMDGVERVVPSINKYSIIEELCSYVDILNNNRYGAENNYDNLSYYTKLVLQYGTIPDFIRIAPTSIRSIYKEERRRFFLEGARNMQRDIMARFQNMNFRHNNGDGDNYQEGVDGEHVQEGEQFQGHEYGEHVQDGDDNQNADQFQDDMHFREPRE